jgi:hypothetical protein
MHGFAVRQVCGSCHVLISAAQATRRLPCTHVLHESCVVTLLLEASQEDGPSAGPACCPTCGELVFPNLVLKRCGHLLPAVCVPCSPDRGHRSSRFCWQCCEEEVEAGTGQAG